MPTISRLASVEGYATLDATSPGYLATSIHPVSHPQTERVGRPSTHPPVAVHARSAPDLTAQSPTVPSFCNNAVLTRLGQDKAG